MIKKKVTKKTKPTEKSKMSPLEEYVFTSYKLAKRIVAGYIVRGAKKEIGLKSSLPLFESAKNKEVVEDLFQDFCFALGSEIRKVAGWKG